MFDYWNKTNLTADDNSSKRVTPSLPKDPFTNQLFPPAVLVELLAARPNNIIDPLQTLVNVVGDKKNGIYTTGPYLDLYKFEIIKKDIINFFISIDSGDMSRKILPTRVNQIKYEDVCGFRNSQNVRYVSSSSTQEQLLNVRSGRGGPKIIGSIIENLKLLIRDSIVAYFLDRLYIQHLPDLRNSPRGLKKYTDVAPGSLDCTVFSSCFITSYLTASYRNMIYKKSLNSGHVYHGPDGTRYIVMSGGGMLWNKSNPIPSNIEVYAYKRFSNLVRFNNFSMISSNLFFTANLGLSASTLRKSSIIAGKTWATQNDVDSNTFLGYEWVDGGSTNAPCDPVITTNINTSNPCRKCIRNIGTGGACRDSINASACNKHLKKYSSSIVQIK